MKRTLLASVLVLLAQGLIAAPPAAVLEKPAPPADLSAPPPDAEREADGLISKQLTPGNGSQHPADTDFVHVRYAVWKSPGGDVVDFTRFNGTTFVSMDKLLPGMRELIGLMVPGERRRGWIPEALGGGKIASGQMFVMDAELVDIVPPPAAPADVAAPPADATRTPSGLAYKVLRAGTGSVHPRKRDTVQVDYSGWTTDGRMFDTSVTKGEPAEFALTGVIPGWTEGLQLMTEGEQVRFWIPSDLAYRNKRGMPKGMLVFDVTLVKIK